MMDPTANVRVLIALDYSATGCRCMSVTGPFQVAGKYGHDGKVYRIGVFIQNAWPNSEDVPDITIEMTRVDVITMKNALAAMLLASEQR